MNRLSRGPSSSSKSRSLHIQDRLDIRDDFLGKLAALEGGGFFLGEERPSLKRGGSSSSVTMIASKKGAVEQSQRLLEHWRQSEPSALRLQLEELAAKGVPDADMP